MKGWTNRKRGNQRLKFTQVIKEALYTQCFTHRGFRKLSFCSNWSDQHVSDHQWASGAVMQLAVGPLCREKGQLNWLSCRNCCCDKQALVECSTLDVPILNLSISIYANARSYKMFRFCVRWKRQIHWCADFVSFVLRKFILLIKLNKFYKGPVD